MAAHIASKLPTGVSLSMPINSNYVNQAVVERIITMRMREFLSANVIARRLALPPSTVRNVLAQEGIQ
jgi:hypothetical protein